MIVPNPHRENYVKEKMEHAPIVVDPRTGNTVAEGSPGVLQFYNPVSDKLVHVILCFLLLD